MQKSREESNMSRVRLTSRQAADAKIPYPGNVNQPRKDPAIDEYHTFEQKVNHELPDMRHEWKDDERDDIGFGVSEEWGKGPTVASVRVAANKAVRVAVLLLGEKVDDEVIEAQARDLMSMSAAAMDRTLTRFADTQKLYADDDNDEDDAAEAKCGADEKKEMPDFIKEKIEDKKEDKKAADEKVEEKKEEKVEEKKAADEKPAEKVEEKVEEKKAADEKVEDKKEEKVEEKEAKKSGQNDMDIELTGAMDEGDEEVDAETASQLASLFAADEDVEEVKVDASKKAGIKKLGGQPRVASASSTGATDISNIWETAPDVSEVFR